MIYIRTLAKGSICSTVDMGYPYDVSVIERFKSLEFTSPITLFTGDNGCGKTTLMELLAQKLNAIRIDSVDVSGARPKVFARLDRTFTAQITRKPTRTFFFHAEGFVRYTDGINEMKKEARIGISEVQRTYAERSEYAKQLAVMPYLSALGDLENMYAHDLTKRSHGEGFLDFFGARMIANGLYLMDEPESALTFYNQYVLMHMLSEAINCGCQFIISTHSPILLAYPNACLFQIIDGQLQHSKFEELANVQFLAEFLSNPKRYTHLLEKERS